MKFIGYSLMTDIGTEFRHWGALPASLTLPNGDRVEAPQVGQTYAYFTLVERWLDETLTDGSVSYDQMQMRVIIALTPEQALDEQQRIEVQLRLDEFQDDTEQQNLRDKLRNATRAEIDAWLLANVTNLVQARQVLGSIIKYLATRA